MTPTTPTHLNAYSTDNQNNLMLDSMKLNSNTKSTDNVGNYITPDIPRSYYISIISYTSGKTNNYINASEDADALNYIVEDANLNNDDNLCQCISSDHSRNSNCHGINGNDHNHVCFRHHHRRNSIAAKFDIHSC